MTGTELLFLTGLGLVYAVAFAVARNLVVLWPLLTPLGSFYANLEAGDIELPWASIAGFADVFGLMVLAWWLTLRHQRRRAPRGDLGRPAGSRSARPSRPPLDATAARRTRGRASVRRAASGRGACGRWR